MSVATFRIESPIFTNARRVLVPACDDQMLWNGHASMIQEIMVKSKLVPDVHVIFCSVGEGGLPGGVIHGCAAGWDHGTLAAWLRFRAIGLITVVVPIVAIENAFYSTMALNEPWKDMHGKKSGEWRRIWTFNRKNRAVPRSGLTTSQGRPWGHDEER